MCFVVENIVKLTHNIVRVLKGIKIGTRRGMTSGTGIAVPVVVPLPATRGWTFAALSCGGCDRGAVAAASVPQGICGENHRRSRRVVGGAHRLPHGRG